MKIYDLAYGKFLLEKGDLVSDFLIEGKFFEPELLSVFDTLTKEDEVIEVGSYAGDHTVYISRLVKTVYAFEVNPPVFEQLKLNLMLNNCRNVKIFNKAVGLKGRYRIASASKADEWYPREDNVAGTRLVEDTAGEFEAVSLDGFISPNNLRLIKTDCEGMDLEILQGAYKLIELFHPKIVFEFNGLVSKQPLEDYIKYLESFNYTVTRIGNWNWLAV